MGEIIPLILCGGSGARLWPLSQADRPKQFLSLLGTTSLFAQALARCSGKGFSTKPIIVSAEAHAELVSKELCKAGRSADVVLEPVRRDSCAAVLVGSMVAMARDVDAVVLVAASDHYIPDDAAYRAAVVSACDAAEQGLIVTFGVTPTEPATGYGYIAPSRDSVGVATRRISSFKEKPDLENARCLVAEGCLWNSGNFLFRARELLEEARQLAPDVYDAVTQALAAAQSGPHGLALNKEALARSRRISFDVAIMEKTERAAVLPVNYVWRDLGTWDAVAAAHVAGENGNQVIGSAKFNHSHDCMVHSEGVPTALVGCEGLIVVATPNGVLVARKGATENVKMLGEQLLFGNERVAKLAEPSCAFEVLDKSSTHCVSRITIAFGQSFVPEGSGSVRQWFVLSGRIAVRFLGRNVIHAAGHTFNDHPGGDFMICNIDCRESVLIEIERVQAAAIRGGAGQLS